jgi:hypothetical protein
MDTVRASNNGYSAEMFVVTFNHANEAVEDGSKIKIMLVSSQQTFSPNHNKHNSAPIQLALDSPNGSSVLASSILFSTPSPRWNIEQHNCVFHYFFWQVVT